MGPPHEAFGEFVRVEIGHVSLDLPAELAKQAGNPVDTAAAVFAGAGLTVIVDAGPFADRLDSYSGKAEFRESAQPANGRAISFKNPERGTYTMAVRIAGPKPATVTVEADASVPERVARKIIDSVRTAN